MRTRPSLAVALATAIVIGLAGCGSSSSHATTTSGAGGGSSDPGAAVIRSADVTGSSSGYRVRATLSVTGAAASIRAAITGTILRAADRGAIDVHETVVGHTLALSERYSGRTYWISASGIPDASRLTAKPWLRYDISSTLDQLGLGGLPSGGSDPTQFLAYLKAVGAQAHALGTETIGGVPTTHYAVRVDLNHYARLVGAAQQAAARQAIRRLIATIGSDQLAMQVWIDRHHLTRQLSVSFPECVSQQHLRLALTMDLFDFGTTADVTLPTAAQSYDITPLVDRQLAHQKLGCSATG